MTDKVDKKIRSRIMAGIRSKDNKPELLVRRFLFKSGFRYRLQDSNLLGKPDLVIKKYKLVGIQTTEIYWNK